MLIEVFNFVKCQILKNSGYSDHAHDCLFVYELIVFSKNLILFDCCRYQF